MQDKGVNMRKLSGYAILATALSFAVPTIYNGGYVAFAQEATTISDEAQMLYEDAISQNKKGKKTEAISSYIQALRKDRTVLALDDDGLIEASYKDCLAKLEKAPEDVKLLETCGFLASVGFSDNITAITYYEKIIDLVDDENVKDRTRNLIERLRATAEAQQSYDSAVAASMRDERIKSWSEMEKNENAMQERDEANERSSKLNEAYSSREELQNRIPQLEQELKDIQEDYDKADRLWYSLKDELYERRRRRLKRDLAAKKEELEKAQKELKGIESDVKSLEKEDDEFRKQQDDSAFNNFVDNENEENEEPEDDDSAFNSNPSNSSEPSSETSSSDDSDDGEDSSESNDYDDKPSAEYEDEYSEEALKRQTEEMSDEERREELNDLIDNL